MSLAGLIRNKKWAELEDAWTTHAAEGGEVGPALEAVSAAASKRELPRITSLIRDHAEMLAANDSPAEAAQLLGASLLAGGSPGELAKPLFATATAAWSSEDFWETYCSIADFRDNVPDIRKSWRSMDKLLALVEGRIVYHAKGWGLGRIEKMDQSEQEAHIRFLSGRKDRFPFTTAVDIFEMLATDDMRCLVVEDPDKLRELLKEEPLQILRWVVVKAGGKVNHAGIKLAMITLGVDGAKFTAFWRKAQKLAEQSEWFELSGPATKRVVRLLHTAEDPAQALKRQLLRSRDLGEALTRVRSIVGGEGVAESVRIAALEALSELVSHDDARLPQRLAAWIFLREAVGEIPPELKTTIEQARAEPPHAPGAAPKLWQLFSLVPGLRDQERCIELFQAAAPDTWLDEASENLPHAAPGMIRGLVDALFENDRSETLVAHYGTLLARPTRNPGLLVLLAEKIEGTDLAKPLLPPPQRAQCLLQLAVFLQRAPGSNNDLVRARNRLATVLAEGKKPLLPLLLGKCDVETMRGLASMIEAGVDRSIDRMFTKIAIGISPVIFRGEDRPFWEGSIIWTTREALVAREEELRILLDIKIPENSEAIGRAASFGDLSENAEWEAALEDQRHLTQRAMELEEAIRSAQLLENAVIPDKTVAPGTKVRYVQLDDESEHEIQVLGPWDADGEKRVSYRSPLAAGMLGRTAGDEVTIELPNSTIRVRVKRITAIEF
ncbi:MAG: hypothetical protein CMJ89_08940 [Planctomycetes bacterium]|jgi:transcription elongation factor GreA|nr:hypothetical protein [Planctomycetota bacterium]